MKSVTLSEVTPKYVTVALDLACRKSGYLSHLRLLIAGIKIFCLYLNTICPFSQLFNLATYIKIVYVPVSYKSNENLPVKIN